MLHFHPLRVSEIRPEAEDAVALTLDVPPELQSQFRSRAGQHIVVRASIQGQEERRTYSLIGAAGELPLRIAVRVHPQGRFSRYIAQQVRVGDVLEVMTPNGSFGPHNAGGEGGTYVAFAAGCGITPVISIVRTLLKEDPRCRVQLFYGNKNSARTMLFEELQALKDRYLDRLALHFVMSAEPQEVELLNGRLDAERVRAFAGKLFDPASVREFFICGPGTMIEDVSGALRALGVDATRIHSEHFSVDAPARAEPKVIETAKPLREGVTQVTVLMDGRRRTFEMQTDSETILDAAARAGVDLPYSCKAGVCSTCRTKLVSGKVELAENYALEDWELEEGFILACQARAKTPEIELDYDEK